MRDESQRLWWNHQNIVVVLLLLGHMSYHSSRTEGLPMTSSKLQFGTVPLNTETPMSAPRRSRAVDIRSTQPNAPEREARFQYGSADSRWNTCVLDECLGSGN